MRWEMVRKKDQKNLISEKGKGCQIERVEHGANGGEEEMKKEVRVHKGAASSRDK